MVSSISADATLITKISRNRIHQIKEVFIVVLHRGLDQLSEEIMYQLHFCILVLDRKRQQIQIFKNLCSCALSDVYKCIELHSSVLLLLLKCTVNYFCRLTES